MTGSFSSLLKSLQVPFEESLELVISGIVSEAVNILVKCMSVAVTDEVLCLEHLAGETTAFLTTFFIVAGVNLYLGCCSVGIQLILPP